ncbi:hypothetical protein [Actinocorallia longicatena]|uniref:Uncharacterized protein n=1 Tax=Actinocorallia longicatena TaxID=111803 RepID=A0ABP6QF37_9ACTN
MATTIREHIEAAEKLLAEMVEMQGPADRTRLAELHLQIAEARMAEQRLSWLGVLETELTDAALADTQTCAMTIRGESHGRNCPDNDKGPAVSATEPVEPPEGN